MKLSEGDVLTDVYVMETQNATSILYKKKKLEFQKLKLSKRDTKGTKIRR